MGMYGYWLRVPPGDLERVRADPVWVRAEAYRLAESEQGRPVADRRVFGTEKAWNAFDHLLSRRGFPVSIVFGEESLADDEDDVEWDYGPPRYLPPERVRLAATALAGLSREALVADVDPADLRRAGIYPDDWGSGELSWVVSFLPDVASYFGGAARDGDAVVCWIA